MLSRTAEAFYWIGRYIERAEYTARLAGVHHQLLVEGTDEPVQTATWTRLLEMGDDLALYRERHGAVRTVSALEFLALERENPNSLVSCIAAARENARTIQDQISSEVWGQLNRFYLEMQQVTRGDLRSRTHEVLKTICDMGYTLQGVILSTMLHDERLAFYQLGRDVERAQQTLRLLQTPVLVETVGVPEGLEAFQAAVAVLKSASAYEAYRKTYRANPDPVKIVEFMLLDEQFPRSVRFCTASMRRVLAVITGQRGATPLPEPERLVGQLASELDFASLADLYQRGLPGYLEALGTRLGELSDAIGRSYFRYADALATPSASLPQRRMPFPANAAPTSVVKAVLAVRNELRYAYDTPVTNVRTVLRLVPSQRYGRQRLLDVAWSITPAGEVSQHVDAFGNVVWQVDHARIERDIVASVEMLVENHAVYHAEGALGLRGLAVAEEEGVGGGVAGPVEYTQLTPLVDSSEGLLSLARQLAGDRPASAHLAEAFMREVHARMRYEVGVTGVTTSASQAFGLGAGVCQDYAHVMIALCRLSGLSARYVSGYLPSEGVMHAWAEVLVAEPASGRDLWVAYDPTHARRADETYVTVAVGRDYADVTPSSGFYTGQAQNQLGVAVSVKVRSRQPIARGAGTAPLILPGVDAGAPDGARPGQAAQQQQ